MEKEAQTVASADKQRRSRVYPRYGLETVMGFVETIEKIGGIRIAKATIAAEAKIPSNSSGFLGRISSAKQFGLITVENEKVSTTQRANRIFHEVSAEDKQAALAEAFSEPALYKDLIKKYQGKTLPPTSTLTNVLMNDAESGLEKGACASAASNFVQSATFVGALRNGMLVVPETSESLNALAVGDDAAGMPKMSFQQTHNTQLSLSPPSRHQALDSEFVFEFAGGVHLTIPKNTEISEAIADGELKKVRTEIKAFADKFLIKEEERKKNDTA